MPMKPKTAIWIVCQPRAEAESSASRPAAPAADRAAPASLGSIGAFYPRSQAALHRALRPDHPGQHLLHEAAAPRGSRARAGRSGMAIAVASGRAGGLLPAP